MNTKYSDDYSIGKENKEHDNNLKNPYSNDKKNMSVSKVIEKERRRLPIKAIDRMDDRTIEIPSHDVVHDGLMHSYKSYTIVSMKLDNTDEVAVHRRYSDFEWLVCQLIEKYPCCIIPPLPQKSILTNINQENQEFIEGRKRGLKLFLIKVFKHRDLRYAPEFVEFMLKNDGDFAKIVEQNAKKNSGFIPAIANIIDYMPSVPGYSFLSNLISNISGPTAQAKREKTELDTQLENYNKHIEFLEQSMNEILKYVSQIAQIERDQATMMVNVSVNLSEIDKLNQGQKIKSAEATSRASDKSSEVQKDHAKFLHESLELPTQDVLNLIAAVKDSIKRRSELIDAVDKNDSKLIDLKRQNVDSAKIAQSTALNDENKKKLDQINNILPLEIEDFKRDIVEEMDQIVKRFLEHQVDYSGKVIHYVNKHVDHFFLDKMVGIWASK